MPAERRAPPGGSLPRGAALEVPDASLQTWPAASTAPFNWVRNPGEKTSMIEKNASTRFSQEPEVGVKFRVIRGWRPAKVDRGMLVGGVIVDH